MIRDEVIARLRDRHLQAELHMDGERCDTCAMFIERDQMVREHRAMLPLIHGDITKGAIDPLFEAWGQVEDFK